MVKDKVSLFGPSIRPFLWNKLYKSLSYNDIDFEIIFVGHVKPDFKLPENFKFIYAKVKPSQCSEIAFRETTGNYVMYMSDDYSFTKNYLDKCYEAFIKEKNENIVVSGRFISKKRKFTKGNYHLVDGDFNTPIIPIFGFYNKKIRKELGSIDSNFIGACWQLDIALRLYEKGGYLIFVDDIWGNEKKIKSDKKLWTKVGKKDLKYLYSCWIKKDGQVSKKRLKNIIPFHEKNILKYSQGRNLKFWK